ncbi:MAG TPA: hypothetical protein VL022_08945 [Moheibacter sp.]|nr:hypothetical protein [Moheibacter sp.]
MIKRIFAWVFLAGSFLHAQENQLFKTQIEKHCGKSYEGTITEGAKEGDGFTGERLVMQVLSCEKDQIKIPFYVGEDQSRTWVLTFENDRVELKHDHRNADGSDEEVTMYGGTSTNVGHADLQMFPADQATCSMIDYACHNVWWMTIDGKSFSYNLRRIGSDRQFTVVFDLTQPIEFNKKPWGWKAN